MNDPYQILDTAPTCTFPVRNEATGNTVWYAITPYAYGVSVSVHSTAPQQPGIEENAPLALIHVDYFVRSLDDDEHVEVIQALLYNADDSTSNGGDPTHEYLVTDDVQAAIRRVTIQGERL